MTISQSDRAFKVSSPLGEDVLLFQRMNATEQLGRPFEFTLDVLSTNEAVSPSDLLGQPVTVSAELLEDNTRYFNGLVKRFTQIGRRGQYAQYQLTLVPWLWFLTRTSDCRIFQEMTVPDIIKAVFGDYGFSDFTDSLAGSYRSWEYCVQYRETAFNFVSRLMEREGIYYYFQHDEAKHTLCLADGYGSHDTVPGYAEVPYFPPGEVRERDHIFDWSLSQQVKPGAYALDDYDFQRPNADLLVNSKIVNQHANADYERYDYPGDYTQVGDGDQYVRTRIEQQQAEHERTRGHATARGLQCGALFSLSDYHLRPDQNREYLIVSTTHNFQSNEFETGMDQDEGDKWECSFEAMDSQKS